MDKMKAEIRKVNNGYIINLEGDYTPHVSKTLNGAVKIVENYFKQGDKK